MRDTTWWRHVQHYTPVQYITYMIQTLIKNYLGMQVIRDPLMIFVKFTMLRKKYGKNHLERHLEICKKPGDPNVRILFTLTYLHNSINLGQFNVSESCIYSIRLNLMYM